MSLSQRLPTEAHPPREEIRLWRKMRRPSILFHLSCYERSEFTGFVSFLPRRMAGLISWEDPKNLPENIPKGFRP